MVARLSGYSRQPFEGAWHRLAASADAVAGRLRVQVLIGQMHYTGQHGVARDPEEALRWLARGTRSLLHLTPPQSLLTAALKPARSIEGMPFLFDFACLAAFSDLGCCMHVRKPQGICVNVSLARICWQPMIVCVYLRVHIHFVAVLLPCASLRQPASNM